ncbi:transcriptional regulator with XRE-family HTH domain [Clostridium tetanomorphum]|nr:transcriptional regulator with XRE-family HTH domain [Clostridium tetanomorphum]NRS83949.1 transcriptional regulator with XRE-family HTH domain [Clostridium tetanomorphum]NRZ97168.1 transcriptional regulator with XRE-family HTH domain [Clostridium tetanomorphum]
MIAENLKRLRLERNLSLGQLAELSEVSKVMISQIEKGDTNPTINTIWKIAKGLNVPYTLLIDKHENSASIVKKTDAKEQISEDGTYRVYCYYGNTPNRNFELFLLQMDSGATYTSVGHSEKSQEYITVLDGELILSINDENYSLINEDSICFSSATPHTYKNCGKTTLKAMVINFYPI